MPQWEIHSLFWWHVTVRTQIHTPLYKTLGGVCVKHNRILCLDLGPIPKVTSLCLHVYSRNTKVWSTSGPKHFSQLSASRDLKFNINLLPQFVVHMLPKIVPIKSFIVSFIHVCMHTHIFENLIEIHRLYLPCWFWNVQKSLVFFFFFFFSFHFSSLLSYIFFLFLFFKTGFQTALTVLELAL